MAKLFRQFQSTFPGAPATWSATWSKWKAQFPYHSFVHKPEGMPSASSPDSTQRYLVCFGKRIASEMHRRPHGLHIMTDQNNVGCHGFWTNAEVKLMLDRIVELWKPPTCQLSEMVFTMKKKILKMYSTLNERLFDALPTMVEDEALLEAGLLDNATAGPPMFNPVIVGGLIDRMRVQATKKIKDPPDCCEGIVSCALSSNKCTDGHIVNVGDLGTVHNLPGVLRVKWDKDLRGNPLNAAAADVKVVPSEWTSSATPARVFSDVVAGISNVIDGVKALFDGNHQARYQDLATLMSGSTSKW